jgi:hypothetical protein
MAADGRTPKFTPARAQSRDSAAAAATCANTYILEHIARHSLLAADGGWAWVPDDLPATHRGERQLESIVRSR